jgi:hypothetical protein
VEVGADRKKEQEEKAMATSNVWSGESDTLTIGGVAYDEVQSLTYSIGNPRLVSARAMGNLTPQTKEIGLADDQPIEITGLVASSSLLTLGGKLVTVIHNRGGTVTLYQADVRFNAPELRATHDGLYILNLRGNAEYFYVPNVSHLQS